MNKEVSKVNLNIMIQITYSQNVMFSKRFSCTIKLFFLGLLLIGTIPVVHAQDVPSTADPSRIESRLPQPAFKIPPAPALSNKQSPVTVAVPPEAAQYRFILNNLNIEGVTAYKPDAFDDITSAYIGKTISVADLYLIAGRITQRYQDDGYILSSAVVPAQEIDGGVVRIIVNEGYIDKVVMNGDPVSPYPANAIMEDIKAIRPLNIHQLERKLLLLENIPGTSVQAILEPLPQDVAANKPGAVLLNTVFKKEKGQTVVSLDNNGSKFVGPWQAGVRGSYAHDMFFTGQTGLGIFVSPQLSELVYLSLSEAVPISSDGLVLNGELKYSRSEPGSTLSQLELYSLYKSINVGLEYPVILSRQKRFDVYGSFEANNISSDILSTRFYEDRLRIIRAGGRYQMTHQNGDVSRADLTLSQGLDIFGSRETGSIDLSRAEGESDFTKVTSSLSHYHFITENLSLFATVTGQYSPSPLLSSEEFGYGGSQIGRGYDSSEITGDSGMALGLELSYLGFAQGGASLSKPRVEPFLFYDVGKVWNEDDGIDSESGSSAGAGIKLGLGSGNISLTVAQPLSRRVQNPTYGNGKNPRYLLSMQYAF